MRHILLVLAGLLILGACSDTTAPNLVCTGAVEVDIHVTRFGADTVATCVVAPPDTVIVTDTLTTPPDTIYVPHRCRWHWHHWHWICDRGGHDHD